MAIFRFPCLVVAFFTHSRFVASRSTTARLLWSRLVLLTTSGGSLRSASSACPETVRYRSRLAYDGSGFRGFQLQSPEKGELSSCKQDTRTVQGCIESVLKERLGCGERVAVVAAGRTDAGVHAAGQAIHFDVPLSTSLRSLSQDNLQAVERSLNRMLPPDVRMWNLQPAPVSVVKTVNGMQRKFRWNVMYDSTSKLYSYRLSLAPVMDPRQRHFRWHPLCWSAVDVKRIQDVMQLFEGTHDFGAFGGGISHLEALTGRPIDTVRTVYSVKVVQEEGGDNYRIDFRIKGALYKQIRNMVGTGLDVCRGRLSRQDLQGLLDGRGHCRQDNPSQPAPPEGLTLEHVFFADDTF